jgi:outer membrane protein assembly factor BamB
MKELRALAILLLAAPLAAASDWPQWLGPRRDGSTDEIVKPWTEPLKILWKTPVGEGHSSPIVADGMVYLHARVPGKNEESLQAFDAATGAAKWTTSYPRAFFLNPFGLGPRGTPAIDAGKIYSLGITGILSCIDAKTGEKIWLVDTLNEFKAKNLTFGISGSPIIDGDNVLINVGAKGASIVAFHKKTGKEVWKTLDDAASYSSPIIYGKGEDRQAIFLTGKGIVSVSPAGGSVFWQHPFQDKLAESSTTPVVLGDTLFVSSVTLGGTALKLDNSQAIPKAKELWMKKEWHCYFSTPATVGKDHIYLVTGQASLTKAVANLHCVELSTGKSLWKRDKVGKYHASLARTGDDKLLLIEEDGDMVLLQPDPKEYRELCRTKICGTTWAHPAISNGRLYIRDAKELICVELPK